MADEKKQTATQEPATPPKRRAPKPGNVFVQVRQEARAKVASGEIELDRERGGVAIPAPDPKTNDVEVPERIGVAMARSRPDVYALVVPKG